MCSLTLPRSGLLLTLVCSLTLPRFGLLLTLVCSLTLHRSGLLLTLVCSLTLPRSGLLLTLVCSQFGSSPVWTFIDLYTLTDPHSGLSVTDLCTRTRQSKRFLTGLSSLTVSVSVSTFTDLRFATCLFPSAALSFLRPDCSVLTRVRQETVMLTKSVGRVKKA